MYNDVTDEEIEQLMSDTEIPEEVEWALYEAIEDGDDDETLRAMLRGLGVTGCAAEVMIEDARETVEAEALHAMRKAEIEAWGCWG
jgi:hypothetical protein